MTKESKFLAPDAVPEQREKLSMKQGFRVLNEAYQSYYEARERGEEALDDQVDSIAQMIEAMKSVEYDRSEDRFSQYHKLFERLDAQELELVAMRYVLDDPPDDIVGYAMEKDPLLALAIEATLTDVKSDSPDFFSSHPVREWYTDTLEKTMCTYEDICKIFNKLRELSGSEHELADRLIQQWEHDLLLTALEIMDQATSFAIALQESGSGLRNYHLLFNIHNTQDLAKRKTEMRSLVGDSNYFTQYPYLQSPDAGVNSKDRFVIVPVPFHVRDIQDFANYYSEFWSQMAEHFNPPFDKKQTVNKGNTTLLKVKGFADILLRPKEDDRGQARIALRPHASRFAGFDLRIDRDRKHLTLDMAHAGYEDVMAYTQEVARQSAGKDYESAYDDWVDVNGSFRRVKMSEDRYFPSIMRPHGKIMPRDLAKRASIMIAVMAGQSSITPLRGGEGYTYHLREAIGSDKELHERFDEAVEQLRDMILK